MWPTWLQVGLQNRTKIVKKSIQQPIQKLIKIADLPKYGHPAFDCFESLNRLQSKLMDLTLNSDQNLLVCAPSKTNVALLTMMREIGKYINSDRTIKICDFKMMNVASMRS